jgi:hypothetical protein
MTWLGTWVRAWGPLACLLVWGGGARGATPTATAAHVTAREAWPEGAPTEAAVILYSLYRGNETRLVLADLVKGTYKKLGPAGAEGAVWSADGVWLAYRVDTTLFVVRPGLGKAVPVRTNLWPQANGTYAFSPDGRRLAVATTQGLDVLEVGPSPKVLASIKSDHQIFGQLTWTTNGRSLAACQWNGRTDQKSREALTVISIEGGAVNVNALPGGGPSCEILGPRKDGWLVTRTGDDQIDYAMMLSTSGKLQTLFRVPQDSSIVSYHAQSDAVIVSGETEDDVDPTLMDVVRLASGKSRPWLRRYRQFYEPTFVEGGFSLVCVSTGNIDDRGGFIYVVALDGKFARRVLPPPATKSSISFSLPVARPPQPVRP